MATKIRSAHDFTVGQAVNISSKVNSVLAGKPGRVSSINLEKNTVSVIATAHGSTAERVVEFSPLWLTPLTTADSFGDGDVGRWVTLVGQDGTSRPVTFVGKSGVGGAYYIEGHVELRHTFADNIAITN